jgi:hypothetical protein
LSAALLVLLLPAVALGADPSPVPAPDAPPAPEAKPSPDPVSSPAPQALSSPLPAPPAKGRRIREKEAEGTQAPNRFEADTVIKSKYELNGQPLEVDPD